MKLEKHMQNTQPLISVIIPIYNVEKYLERCLDSVISQDYDNLEIILVDDGATDDSGKIAEKYAAKDDRIIVIHQKNGGLSNARNNGLAKAHGEYVTFIDSDDYVTNDYVSYMLGLLADDDFEAPMAMCSLMNVFSSTGRREDCGNGEKVVLTGKKCIEMMCYHDLVDTCAYAKLTKRELYDNVKFPEGKLFEDIGTTYKLFLQSPKVACGFSPKYFYVIRSGSIVTSGFKANKLELLEMTDKMAMDVKKEFPDLEKAVLRRQVYARFSSLNQTLNSGDPAVVEIRKELLDYLKKNKRAVLSDPKTPKRDRIAYFILDFGFPVYRVAWKQYEKCKGNK